MLECREVELLRLDVILSVPAKWFRRSPQYFLHERDELSSSVTASQSANVIPRNKFTSQYTCLPFKLVEHAEEEAFAVVEVAALQLEADEEALAQIEVRFSKFTQGSIFEIRIGKS